MELQATSCKNCLQLKILLDQMHTQRNTVQEELDKCKMDFTALTIKTATLERIMHKALVPPNVTAITYSVGVGTSGTTLSKKKIQTQWDKADFSLQVGTQMQISQSQTEIVKFADASCQDEIVFSSVGTQVLPHAVSQTVQAQPNLENVNTQTAVMESRKKCQTDLSSFNYESIGTQTKLKLNSTELGTQTNPNCLKVVRGFNWWVTANSMSMKEVSIQEDGKFFATTSDQSEQTVLSLLDKDCQISSPDTYSISCQFEVSLTESCTQTPILISNLKSDLAKLRNECIGLKSSFFDKRQDINHIFEELSTELSKPGSISRPSSESRINFSILSESSKSIESSQSDFEFIPIFSEYFVPKITKTCRSSYTNREHVLRSIPIDSMQPFNKFTSMFKKSNPNEPPPKEMKLGESGGMKYDKDKKRWIIDGVDLPDDAPAKPPPKFTGASIGAQSQSAGRTSRYVDIMGAQEFSQDYKPVTKILDMDEEEIQYTDNKPPEKVITFTEDYKQDSDNEEVMQYSDNRLPEDVITFTEEYRQDSEREEAQESIQPELLIETVKESPKKLAKEPSDEKYEKLLQIEKEKLEEIRQEYHDYTKRTEEEIEEIKLDKEELEETVKHLNEAKAKAEIKIQELEWELRIEIEDKAALHEELKTFELRAIELEKQAIKSRTSDCSTVISESEGCDLQLRTIQLENDILLLKSQIAQKEFTISDYKENFNDMQTQRNLLSKQLERLKHDQEVMVGYYKEERQRLQQALTTTRQQLMNTKEKYRQSVDELENIKGLLEEYEMRVSILSQSKSKMDVEYKKELFEKKQRLQEIQSELLELQTLLEHEKADRLDVEKSSTATEHRCMALQSQLAQVNTQIDELYDQNYKLQQDMSEKTLEIKSKYEHELAVAKAQLTAYQQRSVALEEQLAHKFKELEKVKLTVIQNQKEFSQKLVESYKKDEEEVEKYRLKNKQLEDELEVITEKHTELEDRYSTINSQITHNQHRFETLQSEAESKYLENKQRLQQEIKLLDKSRQESMEKLDRMENELRQTRDNVKKLENAIHQLNQDNQTILQEAQDKERQLNQELINAQTSIKELSDKCHLVEEQATSVEKDLREEVENSKNELIDFCLRYKTLESETDKIINNLNTEMKTSQDLIAERKHSYASLQSSTSQAFSILQQQLNNKLAELDSLNSRLHEYDLEKQNLLNNHEAQLSEIYSQLEDKDILLNQSNEKSIILEHQLERNSLELEKFRNQQDCYIFESESQLQEMRADYEHDISTLNLRINKLEDASSNLEIEKKLLESKLKRQNERILELTVVEENALDLESQVDELNIKIQQLETYNQMLEIQLDGQAKEKNNQLEKEIQSLKLRNKQLDKEYNVFVEKYEQAEERHQESNRQVDELYEQNLELQQTIALRIAEEKQKWDSELNKRLSDQGDKSNLSALRLKDEKIKWESDMINKYTEEKRNWELEAELNLKEAKKRWEAEMRFKSVQSTDSSESLIKQLKLKDEELSVLKQEFQSFLQKYSEVPLPEHSLISPVEELPIIDIPITESPNTEPEPIVEEQHSGWVSSFLGSIFLTDRERGLKS